MRISGSILAVHDNYMEYARQLKYVNVDYLHIDIFQHSGSFKLRHLLDFDDTFLPLDVHLIYSEVGSDDIRAINRAGVSYVNVQYEDLTDKSAIPVLSGRLRANFGLAYTVQTPLSVIEQNLRYCRQVLFMCSEPGVSGAGFNDENYERIKRFHADHPEIEIVVDGGIDGERAERMERLGASVAVSGSFLCKNCGQIERNAFDLKYFNMQDMLADNKMIPFASLPLVDAGREFSTVINIMNRHRLGLVFVIGAGDVLEGIISDGDIRRGFIKYGRDIFSKSAGDLMNPEPYRVKAGTKIKEIYHDLSELHKGIEVIPVLDTDTGRIIGALDIKLGK